MRRAAPIRSRGRALAAPAAIALLVVTTIASQTGAAPPAGPDRISVVASAVDEDGRPVENLTPKDVEVKLESNGATITSVSRVGAPKQVLVLLDTSATWARGPQKMIWNAQCVTALASQLGGASNFVVFGFSDQIAELYNGPADAKRIEKALEGVPRSGESALLEVLKHMGETIARQGLADRTVLVVVSDGIDTVSRASTKDVVRSLGAAGIPLYSLVVMDPSWNGQNMSKLNARAKLLDISKATGGLSRSMNPGEIGDAATRIASMLAGRYRIEIDPGVAYKAKDGARLSLGAVREGVEIIHADQVFAR
jgi:hypothetical protein